MGLFDKQYKLVSEYLDLRRAQGKVTEYFHTGPTQWPSEKNRNLVLGQDTAVELGSPRDASTAFLLWVNDPEWLKNGRISVVGPDLPALSGKPVSFGKIVIAGGWDFDADNSYDRYREMELLRYDVHLKGYMMRGVSQYQREWSRVSHEALNNGFSFRHLGSALLDQYLAVEYVKTAEIIFITADQATVLEAKAIADEVFTLISAMNKMAEELSFNCNTCDYREVCGDVAELRSMRSKLQKKDNPLHV